MPGPAEKNLLGTGKGKGKKKNPRALGAVIRSSKRGYITET
jgi:hypothetical protein